MAQDLVQKLKNSIDQTLLKPNHTFNDYKNFLEESASYEFAAICIPSSYISLTKETLGTDSLTQIATVAGFPLGYSTLESKVFETQNAITLGADEVDYVIDISKARSHDWKSLEEEMLAIKNAASGKASIKAIIETAYLEQDEKKKLCELVLETGIDYIKTSTGFASFGAELEDIKLFYSILKGERKIKASGGIKNLEQALKFIEVGADRLGTSSGISIIKEAKNA
ncbi:MAG: deoxyribose-phosphate aldolase [Bacteriovoracaceae bacterium]